MSTVRICLECNMRHHRKGPRCATCESIYQRARNASPTRREYRTWRYQEQARAARKAQPWCSLCGTTIDTTWDHEHRQVECRACNASHARHKGTT